MEKGKMQNKMMEMCANMSMEECQAMMQNMMNKEPDYVNLQVEKNNKIIGTPELQALFFEWCGQIKEEMQEYLKSNTNDITKLAKHFNVSKESCNYLLTTLE